MKLYLAGHDSPDLRLATMHIHLADHPCARTVIAQMSGHPYRLFSYFYVKKMVDPTVIAKAWNGPTTILDSGLFSLMFGSEQGTLPTTLEAYEEYTVNYLNDVTSWGYDGWIVEADTQRLLGMPATQHLRTLFKDHEDRTIFVWHQPEGLDGLEALALRYDYIAISVPELRMLAANSKGKRDMTGRMVTDLLHRIHDVCRRKGKLPPKIHLLGCTVSRMMQTPLAWSCDSTSWLSGVRFGQGYIWRTDCGLKSLSMHSPAFLKYREFCMIKNPEAVEVASQQKNPEYYYNTLACAHAFAQYQKWLNTRFDHVPMRGTNDGREQEYTDEQD